MPWTKVDADFQIQNLPPPGGGFIYEGINPDTGPFTTSPLQFDERTGFALFDGLAQLQLASLSQWGVVGTAGGQQLQGPLFFCGDPLSSTPPALIAPLPGAVMQNGALGFYNDADGAVTQPKAQVSWDFNLSGSVLGLYSDEDAVIAGGGGGTGETAVLNDATLASITQRAAPFGTQLFDQAAISLELQAQGIAQILPSMTGPTWDFASEFGIQGAYSLEGGAFVGLYATDPIGNIFSGGLLTTVGGGGSVPWANITGTPTTLLGYGILDAVLFPPAPTIGYVLTWNGFTVDWEPGGGGGTPTAISNGGGTVAVDGAGNIASTPNAGSTNVMFGPNANTFISFNGSGAFNAWANNHPFIQCDNGGNHQFLSGTSSLSIANNGTIALNGPNAAYIGTDNMGSIFLAPGPTHGFSVFGAPPVPQQVPSGVLLGFTPNASANPVFNESTWDGGFGGSAYGITDIVRALKLYGWFAF